MDLDNLVIETDPSLEDVRFLDDRLYDYNTEQTGVKDGNGLAIFIRDEQQTIQAGIEGWTWNGDCYIRSLWVHRALRGKGVGTTLLQSAEREAMDRGCEKIVLVTISFQAPGFYQKLGYEIFAELDDFPRHHKSYYLRKRLT